MAHAGLPVPPATRVDTVDAAWIVTPWIEGALGASWLDSPERARHIADRMGRLAAGIRRVADRRLGFDRDAAAPEALAGQASAWRADMRDELDDATASVIDAAVRFLGEHPPWDARLAHGDFAPINVIVDATGEIVALLDLEHARVGPPLLDVAWWGWVVRHHHPDAWSAASATFLTAAGVDRGAASERNLHALRLIRLLEAAATADDDASRRRWIGRLTEAATW
jgi:aminoglycoside phosphotransferase (APT) family kinase protein